MPAQAVLRCSARTANPWPATPTGSSSTRPNALHAKRRTTSPIPNAAQETPRNPSSGPNNESKSEFSRPAVCSLLLLLVLLVSSSAVLLFVFLERVIVRRLLLSGSLLIGSFQLLAQLAPFLTCELCHVRAFRRAGFLHQRSTIVTQPEPIGRWRPFWLVS